ncbi:hypothetical protein C8J57DRAFT_1249802 [Mycena rebaudengoi]|nr:hypothetical protein C8J57DRAFT_1249802 [Mycena rebaudengoi]
MARNTWNKTRSTRRHSAAWPVATDQLPVPPGNTSALSHVPRRPRAHAHDPQRSRGVVRTMSSATVRVPQHPQPRHSRAYLRIVQLQGGGGMVGERRERMASGLKKKWMASGKEADAGDTRERGSAQGIEERRERDGRDRREGGSGTRRDEIRVGEEDARKGSGWKDKGGKGAKETTRMVEWRAHRKTEAVEAVDGVAQERG